MMTRREALRAVTGGLLGAATLAVSTGCVDKSTPRRGAGTPAPRVGDLLIVELADGLALVDAGGGRPTVTGAPAVASPDWTRMASGAPAPNAGTQLTLHNVDAGQVIFSGTLKDRLEPRVVSPDGWRVALATPAGRGASPYRPAGRERTTVVVADAGGERVRVQLPGNFEPEAFSPGGEILFVLEYLPPLAPDRYRVRRLDLATRRLEPLLSRLKVAVPAGAEEEMRGEGRQAVYDPTRTMLFTLYTHQPDHLHTRELADGARDAAPDVHAFVHALHLAEQWAYCIDLPARFGQNPAAGHTITLSPDRSRLYVADATGGTVAAIDPDSLTVLSQHAFAGLVGPADEAAAAVTPDGRHLLVGGRGIAAVPLTGDSAEPALHRYSPTPSPVRGLAIVGDRVYLGQHDEVVWRQWATGRQLGRVALPGLVRLRQATPAPNG